MRFESYLRSGSNWIEITSVETIVPHSLFDIAPFAFRFGISRRVLGTLWGLESVPVFGSEQEFRAILSEQHYNSLCSSIDMPFIAKGRLSFNISNGCTSLFELIEKFHSQSKSNKTSVLAIERRFGCSYEMRDSIRFLGFGEAIGMISFNKSGTSTSPLAAIQIPSFLKVPINSSNRLARIAEANTKNLPTIVSDVIKGCHRDINWVVMTQMPLHTLKKQLQNLKIDVDKANITYPQFGHLGNVDYLIGMEQVLESVVHKGLGVVIGIGETRNELIYAASLAYKYPQK